MHSTQPYCSKLVHCHNIQSCWQQTIRLLANAGIESSDQEARLLLQHVTNQSLTELMCNLRRPPSADELAQLQVCITRRLRGEPLQYILGFVHFYGRQFMVDSRALIPRPESELLIDMARSLPAQGLTDGGNLLLADVGTGSGVIAVSIACEFPNARVLAVDISREALMVSRSNIHRYSISDRVDLIQGDLLNMIGIECDIIIANLPYVCAADLPYLSREIACFEPRNALDGGVNGLSLITRLYMQAPGVLKPGGWLILEVGESQAAAVVHSLSQDSRWESITATADLGGIPRVVAARLVRTSL